MISVLLFEDNKSLCRSLIQYFDSTDEVTIIGAYHNAQDAVAKVRKYKPDVVLMDIQMPGLAGIEALQHIKAVYPQTKVLIHTVFEDGHRIFSAICLGASGYVLKNHDPDEVMLAIRDVYSGGRTCHRVLRPRCYACFRASLCRLTRIL